MLSSTFNIFKKSKKSSSLPLDSCQSAGSLVVTRCNSVEDEVFDGEGSGEEDVGLHTDDKGITSGYLYRLKPVGATGKQHGGGASAAATTTWKRTWCVLTCLDVSLYVSRTDTVRVAYHVVRNGVTLYCPNTYAGRDYVFQLTFFSQEAELLSARSSRDFDIWVEKFQQYSSITPHTGVSKGGSPEAGRGEGITRGAEGGSCKKKTPTVATIDECDDIDLHSNTSQSFDANNNSIDSPQPVRRDLDLDLQGEGCEEAAESVQIKVHSPNPKEAAPVPTFTLYDDEVEVEAEEGALRQDEKNDILETVEKIFSPVQPFATSSDSLTEAFDQVTLQRCATSQPRKSTNLSKYKLYSSSSDLLASQEDPPSDTRSRAMSYHKNPLDTTASASRLGETSPESRELERLKHNKHLLQLQIDALENRLKAKQAKPVKSKSILRGFTMRGEKDRKGKDGPTASESTRKKDKQQQQAGTECAAQAQESYIMQRLELLDAARHDLTADIERMQAVATIQSILSATRASAGRGTCTSCNTGPAVDAESLSRNNSCHSLSPIESPECVPFPVRSSSAKAAKTSKSGKIRSGSLVSRLTKKFSQLSESTSATLKRHKGGRQPQRNYRSSSLVTLPVSAGREQLSLPATPRSRLQEPSWNMNTSTASSENLHIDDSSLYMQGKTTAMYRSWDVLSSDSGFGQHNGNEQLRDSPRQVAGSRATKAQVSEKALAQIASFEKFVQETLGTQDPLRDEYL